MPRLEEHPEVVPDKLRVYAPDWIFQHKHVGYQSTSQGLLVYRLPTLGECLMYHKAALFHPPRACQLFINRIAIYNASVIDDLDINEVGNLVVAILKECFPSDEKIFERIDTESSMYEQGNLAHAMQTFMAAIGDSTPIWDLTIAEAIERVGLAQVLTEQRIKPNEKTNHRPRRQQERPPEPTRRSHEEGPRGPRAPRGMRQDGRQPIPGRDIPR